MVSTRRELNRVHPRRRWLRLGLGSCIRPWLGRGVSADVPRRLHIWNVEGPAIETGSAVGTGSAVERCIRRVTFDRMAQVAAAHDERRERDR